MFYLTKPILLNGCEWSVNIQANNIESKRFIFVVVIFFQNAAGYLQYLDTSVGKMVCNINTRCGRLDVMTYNPYNAIVHLGHPNGTVTFWSPNVKEPVVKMLCNKSAIRSVAIDSKGLYMATASTDRQLKIFDVRTFKPLQVYRVSHGAGELSFSQRGLLAAGLGNIVEVFFVLKFLGLKLKLLVI